MQVAGDAAVGEVAGQGGDIGGEAGGFAVQELGERVEREEKKRVRRGQARNSPGSTLERFFLSSLTLAHAPHCPGPTP